MFDSMDGHIINTFIEVRSCHAIPVFLYQTEGSFYTSSERCQFFVDCTVRKCRAIFFVSI